VEQVALRLATETREEAESLGRLPRRGLLTPRIHDAHILSAREGDGVARGLEFIRDSIAIEIRCGNYREQQPLAKNDANSDAEAHGSNGKSQAGPRRKPACVGLAFSNPGEATAAKSLLGSEIPLALMGRLPSLRRCMIRP
jgi:hypothetical protein